MDEKITKLEIINDYDVKRLLGVLLTSQSGDTREQKEARMLLEIHGVSVDNHPRKDGRWQGRITTDDGARHSVYGKSREEVLSKIRDVVTQKKPTAKTANGKAKTNYTLWAWLDKWLEMYKKDLKPIARQGLLKQIADIKSVFPDTEITKITALDIDGALKNLSTDYKRKRVFERLREALKRALMLDLIKRNPCDALDKPRHKSKKKHALTPGEQERLSVALKGHRYEALYLLMLTTGLRVGEVLALTAADITSETVTVLKNVVFVDGERIVQDSAKTAAGVRTVPLRSDIHALLAPFIVESNGGELFPSLKMVTVGTALAKVGDKIGVKCSPHMLRHTYATRLAEAGINPKARQYLLGHANLDMTENTYTDAQFSFVFAQKEQIKAVFDTKSDTKTVLDNTKND